MKRFITGTVLVALVLAGCTPTEDEQTTTRPIVADSPDTQRVGKNVVVTGEDLSRIEILSFKPRLEHGFFTYSMKVRNVSDENLSAAGWAGMQVNVTVVRGDDVLSTAVSFIDDLAPGRTYTDTAGGLETVASIKGATYEVEIS